MAVEVMTVATQTDPPPDQLSISFPDVRVYLEVPFAQKEAAKALGARWDPRRVQWFCPPGTDLQPLRPWLLDRIYLRGVEDHDTDSVIGLGARYDRLSSGYYITSDQNQEPFARWLP